MLYGILLILGVIIIWKNNYLKKRFLGIFKWLFILFFLFYFLIYLITDPSQLNIENLLGVTFFSFVISILVVFTKKWISEIKNRKKLR